MDNLTKAPHRLETERLVLVAPAEIDAEEIFDRYASDPEVTRYLGWPRHQSIEDTLRFVAFSTAQWDQWPAGPYPIRAKSDSRLLGSTGLEFSRHGEAMTGYVLAKDAWGLGYATEALRAMVDLATHLHLDRLYAFCHPDHGASAHVLEKCGFTRDARWSEAMMFPNLPPKSSQVAASYELSPSTP